MPLRDGAKRLPFLESVRGQLLVFGRQVLDRQPQVVWILQHRQQVFRLLQADLPLARLAGGFLDRLVHGVQTGAGEVRLGVGQLLRIIGAGSLGEGEESFPLQVWNQHALLPRRPVLNKEPRQHPGKVHVLSR
jgi:hypothetical protein